MVMARAVYGNECLDGLLNQPAIIDEKLFLRDFLQENFH